MPVTLKPVFEALGYTDPKQQRGLVKLLQASGAFGDVKGVNGVLTDLQADAILTHVTFNDNMQALELLHQITQESLIGKEPPAFETYKKELTAALADTGMTSEIKPSRTQYDHVLLLGAVEGVTNERFEFMKRQWEQGVRFDQIRMLGSERALQPDTEPTAGKEGPAGNKVVNEMSMMESRYYDEKSRWPEGLEKVRVFEVNTYNKPGGVRANTQDTIQSWLKTHPDPGHVLVVSSQPSAKYQDAAVKSVLPESFHVETIGAVPKNVTIPYAMDRFARQVDVAMTQLKQQLKDKENIIKTPLIAVAPEDIKVDAATYQFRSGGDANGVTAKGRYQADHWDPILHGDPIMLHERLDGTMYVADGHHRVDVATVFRTTHLK